VLTLADSETTALVHAARERTALGLAVICAGGFMDAYSYLTRGHVFATGQTGNIVLLGVHLAQLDWLGVARYLAPIVAFVIGILVSKHVMAQVHAGDHFRMQRWVIAFEAVAFALIALLPPEVPDLIVNLAISFCAALSFEIFRTFGTRSAYASVFCTGNLRSFAETLYDGFVGHDRHEMHRSLRYLALVASFTAGVVLGFFLIGAFGHFAAFAVSALFLLATVFVGDYARDVDPTPKGA
jgi:uncharacterized membrane protein YoaK (UPF0700 family)